MKRKFQKFSQGCHTLPLMNSVTYTGNRERGRERFTSQPNEDARNAIANDAEEKKEKEKDFSSSSSSSLQIERKRSKERSVCGFGFLRSNHRFPLTMNCSVLVSCSSGSTYHPCFSAPPSVSVSVALSPSMPLYRLDWQTQYVYVVVVSWTPNEFWFPRSLCPYETFA